jgi:hypothetical protein
MAAWGTVAKTRWALSGWRMGGFVQELKAAHDQGLIREEEYDAKRKQILDGM